MTDNVIQFPKAKKNSPPQSLEEIQSEIETSRQIHIDEVLAVASEMLLNNLEMNGFLLDFEDTDYNKDIAMTFECLRSLLYKYYKMEHPFQELSSKIFTLQKNGYITYSGEAVKNLTANTN